MCKNSLDRFLNLWSVSSLHDDDDDCDRASARRVRNLFLLVLFKKSLDDAVLLALSWPYLEGANIDHLLFVARPIQSKPMFDKAHGKVHASLLSSSSARLVAGCWLLLVGGVAI
jgi:hypothetical protein